LKEKAKLTKKKFPTRNSRVYRIAFVDGSGKIRHEPPKKFAAYRWVVKAGKRERQWENFASADEAVLHAGKGEEDITPKPRGMTFRTLLARYLWVYRRNVQRPTLEKTRHRFRHFKPLHSDVVDEINSPRIDRLIGLWKSKDYLDAQKSTRTNYAGELKDLGRVFRYYQSRFNNSFFNPILREHRANVQVRPRKERFRKDLLPDEFNRFVAKLEELYGLETPWVPVLARLQYALGGRIQEPAALFFEDFDVKAGTVTLRRRVQWSKRAGQKRKFVDELKRELQRVQPSRKAALICQEWCLKYGIRSGPLFLEDGQPLKYKAIGYRYSKAFEKAGLAQRATHILRHASITEFQAAAKDIYLTKQFAGHRSVTTTEFYAKNRDETLRSVLAIRDENVERISAT
jgi:site-specific recombinase XerD